MRDLVITGGDVVTEVGVLPGHSVLIRAGLIAAIQPVLSVPEAVDIDARGSVVLPGVVNAHAHGCTTGPLFSSGAVALSHAQVVTNLDRHLAAGVTTLVNVCGFGLLDDVPDHVIDVRLSTNHLPAAFTAADLVDGAGLTARHRRATAEELLDEGAVLIGETGSGATLGGGVAAYRYLPEALRASLGIEVRPDSATLLIDALVGTSRTDQPDDARLATALEELGLPRSAVQQVRDLILERAVAPVRTSLTSFAEAVSAAKRTGRPAMFHVAAPSAPTLLDLARGSSANLIAGHVNHPSIPLKEMLTLAADLREAGVVIDVSSLDMIHGRRLATPESADLLAEAGYVDTLSTDYAGGAWEPMLGLAARWWRRGWIDLPAVARLCSTRPAAVLGLSDRGRIAPGLRGDLVVADANDLESVRAVIVAGNRVV